MKRRRLKNKIIIILIIIIMTSSFFILTKSIKEIMLWKIENNSSKQINEDINKYIKEEPINIENLENNIDETNIEIEEPKNILDTINIDFESLSNINKDVVGYIKIEGTNINYTITQAKDNEYYLTHSFDKKYNSAGWVFADFKNDFKTDDNIVLYAHARLDKSMFGTLYYTHKYSWYSNPGNIIFITKEHKYLLEPYSIYKIDVEDYYIQTKFNTKEEKKEFLDTIKKRSIKDFKNTVDLDEFILTLSTCSGDGSKRTVLHAKIKEMK